ncbi:hypothetical protein ACFSQ7_46540 [Paenibacillus rhizoplanae]
MEDVTDVVFRHVVAEAGRPDVFFYGVREYRELCPPGGEAGGAGGG